MEASLALDLYCFAVGSNACALQMDPHNPLCIRVGYCGMMLSITSVGRRLAFRELGWPTNLIILFLDGAGTFSTKELAAVAHDAALSYLAPTASKSKTSRI